jgi:predicted MFS family arabinose efflux permease
MRPFTRRERVLVLALALGTFTGVLNVYLLTPFLTLVATEFGVSTSTVGQLSTTYAVLAGLTGLLTAPLMDRYQRARLLLIGLVISALGTLLSALAGSFAILVLARAIAGIGAALFSGCIYAAVGDAFPDVDKRNRCLGILLSATGIAAVVGIPLLTHIATRSSWRWAAASVLLPLTFVGIGATLLPQRALGTRRALLAEYAARYRLVLQHRETTALLLASLLRNIIWTVPIIYSVAVWVGAFHLTLSGYSRVFLVAGLSYFVASNLAAGVIRRVGARRVATGGSILQLAAALGFGLAAGHLITALLLFCGLFCAAGAVVAVALNALLQDSLPAVRGAVMSLSGTMGQAGSALGGVIGGIILAGVSAMALVPLVSVLTPLVLLAIWRSAQSGPSILTPELAGAD